MPSWVSRECSAATSYCAGHGVCVEATCVCEDGYYGLEDPISCDAYCVGEVVNKRCRSDQLYYVGAMLDFSVESFDELAAHLRLAVELVNNKTAEWFVERVKQVTLRVRLNDSACDAETALDMLDYQQEWARNSSNGDILQS